MQTEQPAEKHDMSTAKFHPTITCAGCNGPVPEDLHHQRGLNFEIITGLPAIYTCCTCALTSAPVLDAVGFALITDRKASEVIQNLVPRFVKLHDALMQYMGQQLAAGRPFAQIEQELKLISQPYDNKLVC